MIKTLIAIIAIGSGTLAFTIHSMMNAFWSSVVAQKNNPATAWMNRHMFAPSAEYLLHASATHGPYLYRLTRYLLGG